MKRNLFAVRQAVLLAACKTAVNAAGGPSLLSKKVGLTPQAVGKWKRVPSEHVLAVEEASGISRYVLRPDVYGKAPKPPKPVLKEEENGVPA